MKQRKTVKDKTDDKTADGREDKCRGGDYGHMQDSKKLVKWNDDTSDCGGSSHLIGVDRNDVCFIKDVLRTSQL